MVVMVGAFNVIDGLVALTQRAVFQDAAGTQLPITNNVKTWGWIVLIWGVLLLVAGFLIFSGNLFGRVIGVFVAGSNAVIQLAFLPHFPLWSFTMILLDVLVIYALVARSGRLVDQS
jgi:hypothetical protein